MTHHQILQLVHSLTGAALAASTSIDGCVEPGKVCREVQLPVLNVVCGNKEKQKILICLFIFCFSR